MGKRSDFPRRDRDTYDTPRAAVLPLLPHLPPRARVWEPCAGAYQLARVLDEVVEVVAATDVAPRSDLVRPRDVMEIHRRAVDAREIDLFITNPPWPQPGQRGEPVITITQHLSGMRPTWLLLPADFCHNRYFADLSGSCVKIVSVGRVSWMENGTGGKENAAWYLFDAKHIGATRFFGRTA